MTYARNQSILYKVTSPQMLADRLRISLDEMNILCASSDNYKRWTDTKTGRPIQEPKPRLDMVHKRVARQLANIKTPDYLHSAIRGRSYITNASAHSVDEGCVKIDVRKFYPSVRAQAVHHFFLDRMRCTGDVAGILTKLLTVDGHLPTGSSSSPILSFFAYEDMFEELAGLAKLAGCQLTVYIDDMVFTGSGATRSLLYASRKVLSTYRLYGHKTKLFRPGQPRIITGVAVTKEGMKLPNKRQKAIAEDFAALDLAPEGLGKLTIARRLAGRLFEAGQIDPSWLSKAEAMAATRDAIQRRIG
jgi:hypothetical protein